MSTDLCCIYGSHQIWAFSFCFLEKECLLNPLVNNSSLQETYEQKRTEHLAELQKKEEEMRQMFVVRVKEKETELKDAEKEVGYSESILFPRNELREK